MRGWSADPRNILKLGSFHPEIRHEVFQVASNMKVFLKRHVHFKQCHLPGNFKFERDYRESLTVGSAAAVKCITVWYLATHKQILKCKMSAIFLSVISQLSQVSHSFGSQLNHFPKGENFANIAQLLPLIPPVYLFMILVAFSGIIVSSN